MNGLAQLYRAAQLFAHNAHNLARGSTFFEDHEFLGELYGAYELAYDSIVERMIGLGEPFDLNSITTEACNIAVKYQPDQPNPKLFAVVLAFEQGFCNEIVKAMDAKPTDGMQNLLQGLADESEVRQYKLKRRMLSS